MDAAQRPMRADARRNYQRLVEVARDSFCEHGADAPLDDIARRAGVGPGTLYRHFPDRDALIEAVYRADVERVSQRAYELADTMDPDAAVATWTRELVEFSRANVGFKAAVKAVMERSSHTFDTCRTIMNDAAAAVLVPAQQQGIIRPEVQPRDVLRIGHGIGLATETDPEAAERLLTFMLDGLRPQH